MLRKPLRLSNDFALFIEVVLFSSVNASDGLRGLCGIVVKEIENATRDPNLHLAIGSFGGARS